MQDFYSFFFDATILLKVSLSIIFSFIGIYLSRIIFYRVGLVDNPNIRSNHTHPIALGAGIIIIPLIVLISLNLGFLWEKEILLSLSILYIISILDDIRDVNPIIRLLFHFFSISIFVAVYLYPFIGNMIITNIYMNIFFGLIAIISIVWFINSFNFMDGIDGITSVEIIFICLSIIYFHFFLEKEINILALSILITVTVFIYFNWSPASIFLGDSGSIPLGFLIITLLIDFSLKGYWVASIILPLYYTMDTSVTLFKRVYKKKKFWKAHNEHYYQMALKNGFSHIRVNSFMVLMNIGLFLLSFLSLLYKNNITFLILGIAWCSIFLYYFSYKQANNEKNS